MKKIFGTILLKTIEAAHIICCMVLASNFYDEVARGLLEYGMVFETLYYVVLGIDVALCLLVWRWAEKELEKISVKIELIRNYKKYIKL